ncbi:MAG TPA: hypothetical protein PKW95_18770 [bacterium]|nr:hypothetical protein [bacterium]
MMKKDTATIRVSPGLDQDELEFLDRLGHEAKFSGGRMLSHGETIRAMVGALREIKLNVSGVRKEDELVNRILNLVTKG